MVDEPPEPEPPLLEPERREPSALPVTGDDIFDAFLDGLKISRAELHPSIDTAEAMFNAGQVLREFISGIEKLLKNRAELKSAFRLDQTTVLPRRNNPIKLSENTGDLVKQLLIGREGEYLGPRDATREVCEDLLAHQEAFLDAMTHAFVEFSERFDPEELTTNFERSLGRKPLFRWLADLKYWGLYKDLYPTMTEKGGGRFPQMFAEEFVTAYERHIIESLRENRLSRPLPKVKLEPLSEEAFNAEQAAEHDEASEPADQTDDATDRAPGDVLEDVVDLSGLNEFVDFDDLEAQSDTVVFNDDADQAKG